MSKVLLIDDNVIITRLYGSTLRNAGYSVEVAHDGQAGLTAVSSFKPDLVILDLAMPNGSGLDVLAGIRADPGLAATPVIVFSNTYTKDRVNELWHAGASQVLAKASSTPKQVVAAVKDLLG